MVAPEHELQAISLDRGVRHVAAPPPAKEPMKELLLPPRGGGPHVFIGDPSVSIRQDYRHLRKHAGRVQQRSAWETAEERHPRGSTKPFAQAQVEQTG